MEWITPSIASEVIGALYNCEVSVVGKIPCNILEFLEERSLNCEKRNKIINEISINFHDFSKEAIEVLLNIRRNFLEDSDYEEMKVS